MQKLALDWVRASKPEGGQWTLSKTSRTSQGAMYYKGNPGRNDTGTYIWLYGTSKVMVGTYSSGQHGILSATFDSKWDLTFGDHEQAAGFVASCLADDKVST